LWDARFSTPTASAGLIDGPLLDDGGDPNNRVIKPGSLEQSMLFRRISEMGQDHMPPLATSVLNQEGIDLISAWITSLGGAAPITLVAAGFSGTDFRVTVTGEVGIAYTLESSTNATSWIAITPAVTAPNATFDLVDTNASGFPYRFYRVSTGP
jgi:hypothetical protein